jgi:predicted amidohydrolase YtcJ
VSLLLVDRIVELGPSLERRGDEVLEIPDETVLPGLYDHHLHLRALAASAASVRLGPPTVVDRVGFAAALAEAADRGSGERWIRGIGYHESVAGSLDRQLLDDLGPAVPVRVQHRTGALWTLNSVGVRALNLDDLDLPGVERDAAGRPTGRLYRMDEWLREALPGDPLDLHAVSRRLASLGICGVTEATPGQDAEALAALAEAVENGTIVQRLCLMAPPDVEVPAVGLVRRGPHKILLDDPTLPSPERLALEMRWAHDAGQPVAVHCVTLLQLVVALEALRLSGPRAGDRIEHAAVVLPEQFDLLRRLGVTVVTNPSFVLERGDAYLDEVDPADRPHLYRAASLRRAGIPMAAGTDAPFAEPDPWPAIEAAVHRRTRSGRVLGPDECLDRAEARALFSGSAEVPATPRRIEVGAPSDLCLVEGFGEADQRDDPAGARTRITGTVVAGRLVHRRP